MGRKQKRQKPGAPAHLALYPDEIRGAAAALNQTGGGRIVTRTSCLDDAEQGLSDDLLAEADVLLWWGHTRHKEVSDESAERVRAPFTSAVWA